VKNIPDATSPRFSAPRRLRAGLLTALTLLPVTALIAGCGSGGSSTITIGNQNKADNKLVAQGDPTLATTPKTGPLATKPTVEAGKGPAPTKLETKDIVVGTGKEAIKGNTVSVNYVGALWKTGKEFDSSWKRNEPFQFTLGMSQVIKGWDKGVVGMKVGGRRELRIPYAEAYGKEGNPPAIPKEEALIFVVDLLKVS
jgi:peptidylprolyl isomerase